MATAPIVGTLVFDVSVYVIDPTAPKVIEVVFTFPPAVVLRTLPLFASPSAVASASLIICEYEPELNANYRKPDLVEN